MNLLYVNSIGIDGLFCFFIAWLIFKIRNKLLINKLNIKGQYKFLMEESKKDKLLIYFSKIFKILITIIIVYFIFGLLLLIFVLLMNFITLGGIALDAHTGVNSTFFDTLMDFFRFYTTDLSSYIFIILFINLFIYFIKSIISNNSIHKYIKKNEIQLKEQEKKLIADKNNQC